ncbi:trypsin-like serine peptidase [Verminephrobacter aporrectodeae]|uniref:trypsin-like serine peptidase n=1 Tax=Verminephrobacter aporrectodeae TaxID=1110389 RepID=UPI002243923C|nr:serine protease [Verminephrobacter aporrectodeae]MCW8177227.1 serine protease [Verminephrobacter aporrectodeae subsp. tuberculatae]MCW8204629.1 serine protease [Verminephrobacter aporrectodeae subsp. tuberculatae]
MKKTAFGVRVGLLGTIVVALLVGCSDSGDQNNESSVEKDSPVTQVDGRVQPASAVQDVSAIKKSHRAAVPTPSRIHLGALVQKKTQSVNSGIGPRTVGESRAVSATESAAQTLQQLHWQPTAGGRQVASISFSSEGAYGLRLGVVVKQLPSSAVLRVYRQAEPGTVFQIAGQEVLQHIERNAQAGDVSLDGQTWWTPDLDGDEVTLEVELPAGSAVAEIDIAIPRISHIYENSAVLAQEEEAEEEKLVAKIGEIGESQACHKDATCYDSYVDQRNAVAHMRIVTEGKSGTCTGTLLNDSQSSGTPYFLTAYHCISTQAQASTLQTTWFYRSSACGSRTPQNSTVRLTGGATLVYASATSDIALLKLNNSPPAGAFFAGWDANAQSFFAPVGGLHHPQSDLLKISRGNLNSWKTCPLPVSSSLLSFVCTGMVGNHYEVAWRDGATEEGSSGSALFNSHNKVIGVFTGGLMTCATTLLGKSFYGRFDVAYQDGLKNWLAPGSGSRYRIRCRHSWFFGPSCTWGRRPDVTNVDGRR